MKILVSGPVQIAEAWQTLSKRVNELNSGKHGPFDILLIVPSALGASRPSEVDFPIPLVQESGIYAEHLSVEVAQAGEVKPLLPAVDVLLTENLPENSGAPSALSTDPKAAEWALKTSPRYHFCSGTKSFFQRAPYRNGPKLPVTRLISLCPVGSSEKWIHALNLSPTDTSTTEPPGTTDNPYKPSSWSSSKPSSSGPNANPIGQQQQFFFAVDSRPAASSHKRPHASNRKANKRPRIAPRADCWFCLATLSCEAHLLAHIGEEVYVALPKGGIRKEHVLIVPISHEARFSQFITDEEALSEVVQLQGMVEQTFAQGGFATLYTDRSLSLDKAPQQHGYLEALPIPLNRVNDVEVAFKQAADTLGLQFDKIDASDNKEKLNAIKGIDQYLFVQLPNGNAYIHRVEKRTLDDPRMRNGMLHFGRTLCCNLLNCPERVNWKSCVASKAQETDWTQSLSSTLRSLQSNEAKIT